MLDRGLKDQHRTLLSTLFGSDTAHSAGTALNFSGRDPFWAVEASRSLDKVRSGMPCPVVSLSHTLSLVRMTPTVFACILRTGGPHSGP